MKERKRHENAVNVGEFVAIQAAEQDFTATREHGISSHLTENRNNRRTPSKLTK
jgi:hypothetical protein